ncbi:MAG: hypothetical protein ACXAEF_08820, partial [Candidatus Thorarchaeota archaeon]
MTDLFSQETIPDPSDLPKLREKALRFSKSHRPQFEYAKLLLFLQSLDESSEFFLRGIKIIENRDDRFEEPIQYLWALYYCGHISNILGNEQDAVVVYNKALRYIQELEEYWEETPIYSMETKSIGRRQITTVHKELYSVEIDVRQIKYAIKSVLRNIQHSDRKKSDRANADFLISKELSAINRFLEWNRPGEALEKFFQLLKSHSNNEDLWREFYSFIRKNRDSIEASTWIPVLEKIVNLSPSRLAILPVLAGCYKETSNPE